MKKVESFDEAKAQIKKIGTLSELVLVEEYIEGEEFSVESIVQEGEVVFSNVTKKILGPIPHFVEKGHVVPYPNLTFSVEQQLLNVNKRVIEVTEIQNSIVHLEGKITPNGPVVIEFAVRMPGDRIMELIELSTGVNMYAALVDVLTGKKVTIEKTNRIFSGVNWISVNKEGIIKEIEGLQEIQNEDSLKMIEFIKNTGEYVKPAESSFDRLGYYILSHHIYTELESKMNNVENMIKVHID